VYVIYYWTTHIDCLYWNDWSNQPKELKMYVANSNQSI